jgi:hypothetical protein
MLNVESIVHVAIRLFYHNTPERRTAVIALPLIELVGATKATLLAPAAFLRLLDAVAQIGVGEAVEIEQQHTLHGGGQREEILEQRRGVRILKIKVGACVCVCVCVCE